MGAGHGGGRAMRGRGSFLPLRRSVFSSIHTWTRAPFCSHSHQAGSYLQAEVFRDTEVWHDRHTSLQPFKVMLSSSNVRIHWG